MERKNLLTALAAGLAAVLAVLALGKPGYYLYREVSFDWEPRSESAHLVKDYAHYRGIPFGKYPWDLIELLENNPETRDFVLDYPFREEKTLDLGRFSRAEVPLFLQWDDMWGYEKYGSSFLAVTGCGPTSLAMAGYYLTGDTDFNPLAVAEFSQKNGYYAPGYGSSWTLISRGGPELGLTVQELPLVKSKMVKALEAGHPVILALGPGDFTTTGHYIVLTGVEEGAFRVNDPNSVVNSQRLWSYEELEGQIRNIWEISK